MPDPYTRVGIVGAIPTVYVGRHRRGEARLARDIWVKPVPKLSRDP